jgi:hypothetical protein
MQGATDGRADLNSRNRCDSNAPKNTQNQNQTQQKYTSNSLTYNTWPKHVAVAFRRIFKFQYFLRVNYSKWTHDGFHGNKKYISAVTQHNLIRRFTWTTIGCHFPSFRLSYYRRPRKEDQRQEVTNDSRQICLIWISNHHPAKNSSADGNINNSPLPQTWVLYCTTAWLQLLQWDLHCRSSLQAADTYTYNLVLRIIWSLLHRASCPQSHCCPLWTNRARYLSSKGRCGKIHTVIKHDILPS